MERPVGAPWAYSPKLAADARRCIAGILGALLEFIPRRETITIPWGHEWRSGEVNATEYAEQQVTLLGLGPSDAP